MKFIISYYGDVVAKARTAAGAIRAAEQTGRTYGKGNRGPIIDCDSEAGAQELAELLTVWERYYCVRCNGELVQ